MIESLKGFLAEYGLLAMFVAALTGSAVMPVPSEIVMPFGGFLVSLGYFSLPALVLVSTLGNLAGSLVAYYVGTKMTWIHRIHFLEEHLKVTQKFFDHHGLKAVLFGQMMPAVRMFISLPAGFARVPRGKFMLFTVMGALVWNSSLAYLGYFLGENWELVHQYGRYLSVLVVLLLPVMYLCYRKFLEAVDKL